MSMLTAVQELHQRYYEPLARIAGSLDEVVQGPPLKKLLFMTDPDVIDTQLKPLWQARLTPPSPTVVVRPNLCLLSAPLATVSTGGSILSGALQAVHTSDRHASTREDMLAASQPSLKTHFALAACMPVP